MMKTALLASVLLALAVPAAHADTSLIKRPPRLSDDAAAVDFIKRPRLTDDSADMALIKRPPRFEDTNLIKRPPRMDDIALIKRPPRAV